MVADIARKMENKLKKGKLEPYLKSSELRFDFDGLEARLLMVKKGWNLSDPAGIHCGHLCESKVFQWQDFSFAYEDQQGQDFSFAYEDQQGRIYYNPHQEKEATEYTLYLTAADSLKGSTATVSSLFSPEVGGETHIVIDSGKTQFFQKAHTLAGVVVQLRKTSGWWLLLSALVWLVSLGVLFVSAGWKKGLIRYRFEGLTVYHLVFIQESQDLRFWAAVWYALYGRSAYAKCRNRILYFIFCNCICIGRADCV